MQQALGLYHGYWILKQCTRSLGCSRFTTRAASDYSQGSEIRTLKNTCSIVCFCQLFLLADQTANTSPLATQFFSQSSDSSVAQVKTPPNCSCKCWSHSSWQVVQVASPVPRFWTKVYPSPCLAWPMRLRSRASICAVKWVSIFTSGKLSEPRVDDVDIATKSHIEARHSARWSEKIESQYVQMVRTTKTGKNSISILWLILRSSSTLFTESLSNTLIQNRPGSRKCSTPNSNPNFPTETEKTEAETIHTKTTKSKTKQLIYRVEENPRLLDQTKLDKATKKTQ